MIIVDTSIWIDHLHKGDQTMAKLLKEGVTLMHPMVLGEIAMGSLRNWKKTIGELSLLPTALRASDEEVLAFVASRRLNGIGIGYIDAHLLASAVLQPRTYLWTRDGRLAEAAARLGVDAETA